MKSMALAACAAFALALPAKAADESGPKAGE